MYTMKLSVPMLHSFVFSPYLALYNHTKTHTLVLIDLNKQAYW